MSFDPHDPFLVDSNGCLHCEYVPKVKGRFGLAWVSESPECPNPEPVGWQVEFHDTPSRVETKCQEMVRWINCPPLPRCDPCPPVELCCPSNKKPCSTGGCCKKSPKTTGTCSCCQKPRPKKQQKKCCCCGGGGGGIGSGGGGGGCGASAAGSGASSGLRSRCYSMNGPGTCNNCRFRSPRRF